MFVVDDILLSPFKGFMWMVREIHKAAAQEQENEAQALTTRLSSLYMMLETGQITPEQFDEQERSILARLEQIEGTDSAEGDDDAPGDDGPEGASDAGDEPDDDADADDDADEGLDGDEDEGDAEDEDDLAALVREEMKAEQEGDAPAPDRADTPRTAGEQP